MANLPVPSPRTFTVGETETGAYFNAGVRDTGNFLLNVPICNAVQATVQSVPNAFWQPLFLDSTVVDTYGGHSNVTNNSNYYAVAAGWYLVSAAACFASNATGWRGIRTLHNGSTAAVGGAAEVGANGSGITTIGSPAVIMFMAVGDFVQVEGFQTSGGALNTAVNSDANCALTAVWLHA